MGVLAAATRVRAPKSKPPIPVSQIKLVRRSSPLARFGSKVAGVVRKRVAAEAANKRRLTFKTKPVYQLPNLGVIMGKYLQFC